MMNPIKASRYRAATIALNNMGVSLIERRCYREAMETYDNAIRVCYSLQFIIAEEDDPAANFGSESPSSPLVPTSQVLSLAEVEHRVYRAELHLSCDAESEDMPSLEPLSDDEDDDLDNDQDPQQQPSSCSNKTNNALCICNQYGENMSMRSSPAEISSSVTHPEHRQQDDSSSTTDRGHLVYFQDVCRSTTRQQDFTTRNTSKTLLATLFHNKGQTYRYLSQMTRYTNPQRSEQNLDKAEKFFFFSRQVNVLEEELLLASASTTTPAERSIPPELPTRTTTTTTTTVVPSSLVLEKQRGRAATPSKSRHRHGVAAATTTTSGDTNNDSRNEPLSLPRTSPYPRRHVSPAAA